MLYAPIVGRVVMVSATLLKQVKKIMAIIKALRKKRGSLIPVPQRLLLFPA